MEDTFTCSLTVTPDQYEEIWMAMDHWLERNEENVCCVDIQDAMTALERAWEEAQ